MDPSEIAKHLNEDIHDRGLFEDLYGQRVVAGPSQIDQLIQHIDQFRIDWDPVDPHFNSIVKRFLGVVPLNISHWKGWFARSAQSAALKAILLNKIANVVSASGVSNIHTGVGPFEIHFKKGTVRTVDRIEVSVHDPDLFFAVHDKGRPGLTAGRCHNLDNRPSCLGKKVTVGGVLMWQWFYLHVFTFNRWNVRQVFPLRQVP